MEQEEARQPELADHAQLLLQPSTRLAVLAVVGVALVQPRPAQLGELAVCLGVLRSRVAVAEVAREVELDALRDARGLRDRLGMVGEPGRHLGGGDHHGRCVAAALGLALVEGRQQPHRDERVLQPRAVRVVGVHVARRDAGHAQALGEASEQPVARAVAAPERALELDAKAIAAEGRQQALPVALGRAVARAAGQAHDALRVLGDLRERRVRRRSLARVGARVRMRRRHEPAEVGVAGAVGREQGQVGAVIEGHLHARDRLDPQPLACVRELHRPPQAVVVGERDRLVAVHRGGRGDLLRRRRPVQERVRGVGMQLGVRQRSLSSGLMCRETACQPPLRRTQTSVIRNAWLRCWSSIQPRWL